MKEKDVQTIFGQKNTTPGVFELKLCKEKRMAYNRVEEHQIQALLSAEGDGLYHKIQDDAVSWGNRRFAKKKPFDCLLVRGIPAYVVVIFYEPKVKKIAYYIRIKKFIVLRDGSTMKSMTEKEAKEWAELTLNLNKKETLDTVAIAC